MRRSEQSIRGYEGRLRRPPESFFHDLIETAPEYGLRFNDIAPALGFRLIESLDPDDYGSIHEFFTGVRVFHHRSRMGFPAILSVPASHIAAVEHRTKPEPELVRRLVKAVDGHDPSYGDFVPYLRKWIFGEVRREARREWQSGPPCTAT